MEIVVPCLISVVILIGVAVMAHSENRLLTKQNQMLKDQIDGAYNMIDAYREEANRCENLANDFCNKNIKLRKSNKKLKEEVKQLSNDLAEAYLTSSEAVSK